MTMVECPHTECDRSFERLGKHWSGSPSHRPSLTRKMHEITTGLLMGDGSMNWDQNNPRLTVTMTNKEYLEYVDDIFNEMTTGVSLYKTAAESAKRSRERGFSENAKEENYSDLYRMRSRRHPEFSEYVDWYSTGEKVWPSDICLTPVVLKHWYCGDGSYQNKDSDRITIAMANERDNREKVENMFKKVGLPVPSNWDVRKRKTGRYDCNIYWTQKETRILFQYMGAPLPGFEYKWPNNSTYKRRNYQ